jgi:hypothetical protein
VYSVRLDVSSEIDSIPHDIQIVRKSLVLIINISSYSASDGHGSRSERRPPCWVWRRRRDLYVHQHLLLISSEVFYSSCWNVALSTDALILQRSGLARVTVVARSNYDAVNSESAFVCRA